MKAVHLSLVALLTVCAGCGPRAVTIADVLGNPGRYDGTLIRLQGAAVAKFENSRLCATAAELEGETGPPFKPSPGPCIWLQAGSILEPKALGLEALRKLDKHYVIVTGRFDMAHRGHANCCSGAIIVTEISSTGYHGKGDIPPIPPEPSANNSFKPKPLRGSA